VTTTDGSSPAHAVKPTVGFVGLGIMGLPMALNVLRAGFPVVGFNRSSEAVSRLEVEGGTAAESVGAVAEAADVVITMLPASPDVTDVVTGRTACSSTPRRPGRMH